MVYPSRALVGWLAGLAVTMGLLAGVPAHAQGFSCTGRDCCITGSTDVGNQCVAKRQLNIPQASQSKYRWVTVRQKSGSDLVGLATADGKRTLVKPSCSSGYFMGDTVFVCRGQEAVLHLLEKGRSLTTPYPILQPLQGSPLSHGVRNLDPLGSLVEVSVYAPDATVLATYRDVVPIAGAPLATREVPQQAIAPVTQGLLVRRRINGQLIDGLINTGAGLFQALDGEAVLLGWAANSEMAAERPADWVLRDDKTRAQLAAVKTGLKASPGEGLQDLDIVVPVGPGGSRVSLPPGVLGVIKVEPYPFSLGYAVVIEADGKRRYAVGRGDAASILARFDALPVHDGLALTPDPNTSCQQPAPPRWCARRVSALTSQGWVILKQGDIETAEGVPPQPTPAGALATLRTMNQQQVAAARAAEDAAQRAREVEARAKAQAALAVAAPCYARVVAAREQGRWSSAPEAARRWAVAAELRVMRGWEPAIKPAPADCASLPAGAIDGVWAKSLVSTAPVADVVAAIEVEDDYYFRRLGFDRLSQRTEPEAWVAYGRYLWSRGDRSQSAAMQMWAKAANAGDLDGLSDLASRLYDPGTPLIRQDVETAWVFAQEGAARGHAGLQALKLRIEADQQRQAQRDTYNRAVAAAATRWDFIMRCGYIEPSEQHKWICVGDF